MLYLYLLFLLGPAVALMTAMVDACCVVSRRAAWEHQPRASAAATASASRQVDALTSWPYAPPKALQVNDAEWQMTA